MTTSPQVRYLLRFLALGYVLVLLIVPGVTTDLAFSLKLLDDNHQLRNYVSFKEKIETYLEVIVRPAIAAHLNATPLQGIERRLNAFDGTVAVTSPVGGPTQVTMELPCELSLART